MSLHVMQPPARTLHTARTYLGRLGAGDGFVTRGALASSRDDLWLAAPHPVFNLAVFDIDSPQAIERARMTGWRFLVLGHGRAVATMEIAASHRRDAGRFARVTDGRMAGSSARVIASAESGALMAGRRYVLGMLRVPALHVYALWLRDLDAAGRNDVFATVQPVPGQMSKERWLPLAKFMRGLQAVRQSANVAGTRSSPVSA